MSPLKSLVAAVGTLALGFTAQAVPIDLKVLPTAAADQAYYVGAFRADRTGGLSLEVEAAYFAELIAIPNAVPNAFGTSWPVLLGASYPTPGYFSRQNSGVVAQDVVFTSSTKTEVSNSVSQRPLISGYEWVLGKYGAGYIGWYLGGKDAYLPLNSVPLNFTDTGTPGIYQNGKGSGLSHYTVFSAVSVPDGGNVLILLGIALAGFSLLRRKFAR